MTNETYIYTSPWIDRDSKMPYRIVAYKRESYRSRYFHPMKLDRSYVTHIEVDPRDHRNVTRYKIHGNYDLTFEEAIEDANRRYMDKKK